MTSMAIIIIGLVVGALLGSISGKDSIYYNAMNKHIIGDQYDLNEYYSNYSGTSYGKKRKKAEFSEKLFGYIAGGILLIAIVALCLYGINM